MVKRDKSLFEQLIERDAGQRPNIVSVPLKSGQVGSYGTSVAPITLSCATCDYRITSAINFQNCTHEGMLLQLNHISPPALITSFFPSITVQKVLVKICAITWNIKLLTGI